MPLHQVPDSVAVIGLLGEDDGAWCKSAEQDIGCAAVAYLAAGEQEAERPACAIGERVELAVAAAPADPHSPGGAPPFSPPAAASVMNISCQTHFAAHRTNRL